MNTKYFYIIFLSYISLFSLLEAKKVTITDLMNSYDRGDLNFCRSNIDEVSAKNPGNTNILYLRGLIESNGDKSIKYFKELAERKTSTKHILAKKKIEDFKTMQLLIKSPFSFSNYNQDTISTNLLTSISSTKKIIPVKEIETTGKVKKEFSNDGKLYFIQLGAYSSEKNAETAMKTLSAYKPFLRKATINDKVLYLIISGNYDSLDKAEKIVEKIRKSHNLEPLIKGF